MLKMIMTEYKAISGCEVQLVQTGKLWKVLLRESAQGGAYTIGSVVQSNQCPQPPALLSMPCTPLRNKNAMNNI
jgi:hypothetical protein